MKIDWNAISPRIARAGRVRCEPGWRLNENWAAQLIDFDLWFVWAGRGVMQTHLGEVKLRPGMCIWARPGGTYAAQQDPNDRLGVAYIHFDLVYRNDSRRAFNKPLPPIVNDVADVNLFDSVMHRIFDLWNNSSASNRASAREVATIMLKGLLADLDARADLESASPPGTRKHYQKLVSQWASRISESPNSVASIPEIASEAGYCADHFSRVFKSVLGQSPQAFVVQAKINRARQLLMETELTVSQVASALGYEDIYFFSRQFKQKTGRTPTQYRADSLR